MIYTAQCVIVAGRYIIWGGGGRGFGAGNLEYFGPKWHSPIGSCYFKGPKNSRPWEPVDANATDDSHITQPLGCTDCTVDYSRSLTMRRSIHTSSKGLTITRHFGIPALINGIPASIICNQPAIS
jgi:hypothetical protein